MCLAAHAVRLQHDASSTSISMPERHDAFPTIFIVAVRVGRMDRRSKVRVLVGAILRIFRRASKLGQFITLPVHRTHALHYLRQAMRQHRYSCASV